MLPSICRPVVKSASDAIRVLPVDRMSRDTVERFYAIALSPSGRVIGVRCLFTGGQDSVPVDPRVLFRWALHVRARALIIAHNHPSGSTRPSRQDLLLTNQVIEAGKMLGIQIHDHLIVGFGGGWISLIEQAGSLGAFRPSRAAEWRARDSAKTCAACGEKVRAGKRDFGTAHAYCSKAGTDATSPDHLPCPIHGGLVWTVGPYSSYRICGGVKTRCTAGKNSKPWRYCAPRGKAFGAEVTEAEVPEPDPAPKCFFCGWFVGAGHAPDCRRSQPSPETPNPNPSPAEAPMPVPSPAPFVPSPAGLAALGSIGDQIMMYVDAKATEIAQKLVADLPRGGPARVDWTVNGTPFAKIEGAHHKALPRLLKLYAAGVRNFLIVGPAGSGKTTLAHDLATSLETSYGAVSCTSGMSESALTGRAIPNLTTGKTEFQGTDFVRLYENGGVYLLDEVDAADPNVLLTINAALANGHMSLPARGESATRHAGSVIVCSANTWGNGADRQYVGRNQLDAAFLDRFVGATVEVDYDRDLESGLVGDAHICARVWTIREKAAELKLRRIVGTRFLLAVTRLVKGAGETLDSALTACTVGWTPDEKSKVGVRA